MQTLTDFKKTERYLKEETLKQQSLETQRDSEKSIPDLIMPERKREGMRKRQSDQEVKPESYSLYKLGKFNKNWLKSKTIEIGGCMDLCPLI